MNDVKKICAPTTINVAAKMARLRLAQRAEAAGRPFADDDAEENEAHEAHDPRQREPVLEPKPCAHALETLVLVADEVHAVGPGTQPEADRLHAEDDEEAAEDEGVDVQTRVRRRVAPRTRAAR